MVVRVMVFPCCVALYLSLFLCACGETQPAPNPFLRLWWQGSSGHANKSRFAFPLAH